MTALSLAHCGSRGWVWGRIFWLMTGLLALAPCATAQGWWAEKFAEDFDGTAVNTAEWGMYHSPGHNGNGLRRASAFSVSGGVLTCTAKMIDGTLVSGGMAHKRNYQYGRFEFRVRTTPENGTTTSCVVLTWPQSERWPRDGENDIYETTTNRDRQAFHTYIHYPNSQGQDRHWHHRHNVDATQWWTVAMDWDATSLKIYRKQENAPFRPGEQPVVVLTDVAIIPDNPHHICIQLDAFAKTMTGETQLQVDWVRIYQWDVSAAPPVAQAPAPRLEIRPEPSAFILLASPLPWRRYSLQRSGDLREWAPVDGFIDLPGSHARWSGIRIPESEEPGQFYRLIEN